MKVRFKTAHGYLSFQPPDVPEGAARVQYRDKAGPWEEFDIEGLVIEVVNKAEADDKKDAPSFVGPPPSQTAEYVAAVKAQLQAQGVNLSGPCGAFAITKRVAWGLRHLGCGLLSKPSGNNCEGFATDIVMFRDQGGQIIDILGDGGGNNTPSWGVTDTVDPSRWRAPVDPG
jgi:hypothetical protein